jgi:hypothetical protein
LVANFFYDLLNTILIVANVIEIFV